MTVSVGPAARLQIAQYLVALRERAKLKQIDVARLSGCSTTTVARYEDWTNRSRLTVPTVRALAEACKATEKERDTLAELVKAQSEGWQLDDPAVPEWMDPLVSFETAAEYEHVYALGLVPGLLQTPLYALATHQAREVRVDADEIQRKVDARVRRQDILKRADLHLWVVLAESALRWVVGNRAVMREQVDHLLAMARQPNIDIQVLPYTSGATAAGSGGNFVILGRDDERHPLSSMAVVYLELHKRGMYLDAPDDVTAYKVTFDYLRSQAVDTSASFDILTEVRQEYAS